VEVRHDEGVAIHVVPKPCAVAREGEGEASAGECAGQPSSPEKILSRTPTSLRRRKAIRRRALSREIRWSGVVGEPGMRRRFLFGNREIPRLTLAGLPPGSLSGR